MLVPFQVLPTNGCDYQLLLGRTWMQETNFQMQWMDRAYKLQVNHSTLTIYLAERIDTPSTLVEETSHTAQVHKKSPKRPNQQLNTWISDQANPGFGWSVPTSLLRAQGYGPRWRACWVPKSSYKKSSKF